MESQIIRQKIYEIRGQKVMLDFDLAELYGVTTKAFNQAVKRNIDRFPEDFMFRLTDEEWMRSQIVTASNLGYTIDNQSDADSKPVMTSSKTDRRSQIVTASETRKFRNKKYPPSAFTEHGVSMLASVLQSDKAIQMSIAIVRAFIAVKQYAIQREGMEHQIQVILDRLDGHDDQLESIYKAIENLLNEKAEKKAEEQQWKERARIGFKKSSS